MFRNMLLVSTMTYFIVLLEQHRFLAAPIFLCVMLGIIFGIPWATRKLFESDVWQ